MTCDDFKVARLFLAVFPPVDVVEQLGELERPEVEGLRWTNREQWHITLRFFGEAEQGDVEDSLREFRGAAPTVLLGPASRWLGGRVLALPADGLDELAVEVRARTETIGQAPDRRKFTGHLTLARTRRRLHGAVVSQPFDAQFKAAELWLVSSQLHSDGARYTKLSHWPLGEGG
ncbi:RNA 2',3'-cyclic phosphodiesterase [Candidatus Poriferisocius sp.]|uniref:RNA 2',3'-cyclic phosphodiesterase n=1 Tax=Candidatus Poriferisocius sp. TaxID=3101276 RepID=UPI003B59B6DE